MVGSVEAASWPVRGQVRLGQVVVVVALLTVAAFGWMLIAERMSGMDNGPGTDPGSLGFYLTAWVAMMAAMMFPSAAPMVFAHSMVQRRRRELGRADSGVGHTFAFAAGYLVAWSIFGIVAYGLFELIRSLEIGALDWERGGRWAAAVVIALAAAYQLTPLKNACLARCRSPLAFVAGSWRSGRAGALAMGIELGGWCIGCCWALMATLFALGLMSVGWMVLVAALVALEKLLPWKRLALGSVTVLLLGLALAVALVPEDLPGLTQPSGSGTSPAGPGMSAMER
jgi:predicted metal-binding membrane protein